MHTVPTDSQSCSGSNVSETRRALREVLVFSIVIVVITVVSLCVVFPVTR